MFDIGFFELTLIGLVGLLVLGPERLPQAARTAGLWIGRARRMVGEVTREVDRQLKAEEMRERLRKEGDQLGLAKIKQTVDDALGEAKQFEHLVDKDPNQILPGKNPQPSADSDSAADDAKSTAPSGNPLKKVFDSPAQTPPDTTSKEQAAQPKPQQSPSQPSN